MCLGPTDRPTEERNSHISHTLLLPSLFLGLTIVFVTYNEFCLPLRAVKATQLIEFEIEALWTLSTRALETWRYVAKVI
jgi:hypothetical protein